MTVRSDQDNIVLYQTYDGETRLEVHLEQETVWLSQRQMADLFDVKVPAISKHVRNIITSGELDAEATVSKMERVRREGERESGTQYPFNLYMEFFDCLISSWNARHFNRSND
jgi:hypothetical protein